MLHKIRDNVCGLMYLFFSSKIAVIHFSSLSFFVAGIYTLIKIHTEDERMLYKIRDSVCCLIYSFYVLKQQ